MKFINQDSDKPKSKCLKSATILIRDRCGAFKANFKNSWKFLFNFEIYFIFVSKWIHFK